MQYARPAHALKLGLCPSAVVATHIPSAAEPMRSRSDPAAPAMTDFKKQGAATIHGSRGIDDALHDMVCGGVRTLLVVDERLAPVGLITSYDIEGERPLQLLQGAACPPEVRCRTDICVRHIMTPLSELRTLAMDQLRAASLDDLVCIFEATCLTHIVVVEELPETRQIRGIISTTRLQRMLGIRIESICAATSFADLERTIAR